MQAPPLPRKQTLPCLSRAVVVLGSLVMSDGHPINMIAYECTDTFGCGFVMCTYSYNKSLCNCTIALDFADFTSTKLIPYFMTQHWEVGHKLV